MPASQNCDAEIFRVELLGSSVNCTTLEDTVSIKSANDIFTHADSTPYRHEVIMPFIPVLRRYGRHAEAKRRSELFR